MKRWETNKVAAITVNACKATCGSLWLILFTTDRRQSFALRQQTTSTASSQ